MESASLSISFGYKLSHVDIFNFREIYQQIISFYCYKEITYSTTSVSFFPTENKWIYTFYVYSDGQMIKIPEETKLKILNLPLEDYIGMKLISPSALVFMTSMSDKIIFFYKPWGVITEAKNIDSLQLRDLQREIRSLEEEYYYFVKSPSVLSMTDKLNNFHTEFDRYVIVKRDRSINQILNALADILSSNA